MKKTVKTVLCCIMGIYLVVAAAFLSGDVFRRSEASAAEMSATMSFAETASQSGAAYVVKAIGGRIAVQEIASGEIILTTDTRVAILPTEDKLRLEKGIEVKNKVQLRSVLEDYCS